MIFRELVKKYKDLCALNNVPVETVMLYLVELTQKESYNLYMNYENEVSEELLVEFEKGMERILKHEPVQHVIGYSWFYGYKFLVSKDVLIPRPETEELVGYILQAIDNRFDCSTNLKVADIGTGSGAIAISLKKEIDKLDVSATDISKEAIEVAKQNASLNEVDINFMVGDMLEPFKNKETKLDILICNPPYIPSDEVLEDFVSEHEPHVALFGGEDGLKYYRRIFEECKTVLNPKSFMAFEIGYNQKEVLTLELNKTLPSVSFEFLKDINGKDRMLFVYFD